MQSNQYAVPVSIIIAGGFIALAIYLSNTAGNTTDTVQVPAPSKQALEQLSSTDEVRKVTKNDHIKGNPDADVIVVEYSDFECPFCKRFHDTMNEIIEEEGENGKVAWVFRQFPLDQLHPRNARKVAVASECVADIGGNDAFWQFTDGYMRDTLTNDRTDIATLLPKLYTEVGVDKEKIEKCIDSKKFDKKVQDDVDNAIATGGRGTPWSVVIGKDGKTYSLNGAQPRASIERLIDIAAGE